MTCCTHCGTPNADYKGQQKGIDPRNMRRYCFPLFNCVNPECQTSFGLDSEKRYCDDGTRVPPKTEAVRS